jgi:primosomal protein N' (replication factor Y) (superfamily II helicase)
MKKVLKVSIPNTLQADFDYFPLKNQSIHVGTRVLVPFRNSQRLGIISAISEPSAPIDKIKTIDAIIDKTPIICPDILRLCQWVSHYYQAPLCEVIALALPKKLRKGEKAVLPTVDCFALNIDLTHGLSQLNKSARRQRALLEKLHEKPLEKHQITAFGFTSNHIKALESKYLISCEQKPIGFKSNTNKRHDKLALNTEQQIAFDTINLHLNHYQCFLLHGITGSGKTEIYLQIIEQVLAKDKQVLILVPEIGLTPQLVERFEKRFDVLIATFHSKLNDTERLSSWVLAYEGRAKIIIGTRSAVFTPMPNLGLCIIDEEHDSSFKQMDSVRFSARETALMRCHHANIPIILGSATPSLESIQNTLRGKYQLLPLTQKAMNSHPTYFKIIDCRNKPIYHGITDTLIIDIGKHLQRGNQVLIFINRRGYAPVLMCHQCGHIKDCDNCDAHMTLHNIDNSMQCHHCGILKRIPINCANCQSTELLPVGVGTQRVSEYLHTRFSDYDVLRIDKDETRKKNALAEKLNQIASGKVQLIIGTQMLAKGHHFPNLSLVAILDIDNSLYAQDFRAIERMGQLITQVAGRTGRAHQKGEVIIQTHHPDNTELNLLIQKGYDALAHELLAQRKSASFPPYSFLSLIRARAKSKQRIHSFLSHIKTALQQQELTIYGPAFAPLEKKGGYYRMQLLIKSKSRKTLSISMTKLRNDLHRQKIVNGIVWSIDIDPQDMS